jgi:hypothetical protein
VLIAGARIETHYRKLREQNVQVEPPTVWLIDPERLAGGNPDARREQIKARLSAIDPS